MSIVSELPELVSSYWAHYVSPPKVRGDILVSVRISGVGVGVTVCIHIIS